jgi:two-component system sensor histidine kinase YesM
MLHVFDETQNKISLRNKLVILIVVAVLPFFVMAVYLLVSLKGYSSSYDSIVSNMMIANNYNLDFKDELDESIYRLVAGSITLDDIEGDATVQDPYELLQTLRTDFRDLVNITTDRESVRTTDRGCFGTFAEGYCRVDFGSLFLMDR